MKTTAAVRHILHRPTLLATVAGGLLMAFLAGATAHTLIAPRGAHRALTAAAFSANDGWQPDAQAVGRDVYSPRGAPLGRLTAVIGGNAGQGAYALIATYGRDAAVAGEIAIPVSRLDLQGERLVLSGADDSTPDGEPRRWQM